VGIVDGVDTFTGETLEAIAARASAAALAEAGAGDDAAALADVAGRKAAVAEGAGRAGRPPRNVPIALPADLAELERFAGGAGLGAAPGPDADGIPAGDDDGESPELVLAPPLSRGGSEDEAEEEAEPEASGGLVVLPAARARAALPARAAPGLLLRLDSTQVEVDADDADWAPEAEEAEEAARAAVELASDEEAAAAEASSDEDGDDEAEEAEEASGDDSEPDSADVAAAKAAVDPEVAAAAAAERRERAIAMIREEKAARAAAAAAAAADGAVRSPSSDALSMRVSLYAPLYVLTGPPLFYSCALGQPVPGG
jgi:hypothetical protein